jgi:large subunit ribosomal protein L3
MAWIIATKLEMTRVIKEDKFIPITLLKVPDLKVVWFKTLENDWYEAIIIWVLKDTKEDIQLSDWKVTLNKSKFSKIVEFPIWEWEKEKYKVGYTISLDLLEENIKVSIEWFSKWKWFTWAMKKHNFHGWPSWHGSKFHRALGSIGNRKPKRTHKGKKMHGHHGNTKFTIKKVPVELINKEISVIWVRWWVPWWRNAYVNIIF